MKLKLQGIAVAMLLFLFSGNAIAQINKVTPNFGTIVHKSMPNANGIIRCHTMEVDSIMRANNPSMPTLEQEEIWLQKQISKYVAANSQNSSNQKVVITIPIIFHIITSGSGATNISATYVNAQISQLNIDFADLAGSSYAVAADAEIQFCAALVDPLGNVLTEPGINRVTTYGAGPFTQNTMDNTVKPGTQWNPNNYFNVWVANLSGGLLGYAQFPSSSGLAGMPGNGGAANTDGVVILYSSVGSVATPFPGGAPYNLGRTLTHEAGHWLGLRHIWGDGNCGVDDFCADTPLSDASNGGCPNTNSCVDSYGAPWPVANPPDMVENYMDYTNDACMNTFTNDQKTRMQTVLSVSPRRMTLASSPVCTPPVADDIGISAIITPTGTLCGSTFTPEVTMYNYGNTTITSATITYDIDGGASQIYNWTGSLASLSSTNVTLSSMTTTPGAHVFNATTSLPNGNTDGNTANDDNSSNFTVDLNPGIALPISEGFVNVTFPPTNWSITNNGTAVTWVRSGTQGTAPTAGNSAVIDNYNTDFTGTDDDLNMPPADVSAYSNVQLQFDVAYARYNATYFDQLDVVVSTDCGQTWTTVYSKAGTVLATDPDQTAGYTAPSTWRTETVDLSAYAGASKLEVKFRNVSGYGQFLYLDNINLTGAGIANADFTALPNPACVGSNVTFTDASTGATSWSWNFGAGAAPATATGAGPHAVTYATAGVKNVSLSINGGASTSNQNITINALDDASFSYSASAYCVNAADPTPTITGLGGGTFSSSPAGLSINASTGQIDVSASTPNIYTVTYTTAGPCPNSSNVSVTINALDNATFSYSASAYCVNAADPTPTITGLGGGTFSSSPLGLSINASTGQIDVSASTPNAYTVTYTTAGPCPNFSNVSVTINALDNASFSYSASAYCVNAADPTPTITGLGGGTFSSSPAGLSINASTGQIDVSASTPNTYTVTYTTAGTCPNSSNVSVTINALDNASFSYSGTSYCISGADPTPTITGLGGGTFSSSPVGLVINASTGTIDVSASSAGAYTVTYTTGGSCPNSSNVSVSITSLDDPTFTYGASAYCVSASDPTPTANTAGGIYTSSPVGLVINASTGTIDVSASTPGNYTVTYTTGGTCSNASNVSVTINPLDNASFSYGAGAYCVNGSDPTPTITGLSGGTFSSTAGLTINASTGTIDVSASTPGNYSVTYTTNGTCPNSSNVSVTINGLDNASFSYSGSSYCIGGSDPTPTITGLSGGTFSSTAGLTINASTGTIDVSASTPGNYTVTYTTAGLCPNSSNVNVTITSLDDATFNYSGASYCVNGSDPTPTANTAGGTYTSSPAGLVINAATGTIDVSASTPGNYTVTYTTVGACSNSSNVSVAINAIDDATFSYSNGSYCADANDPTPTANTVGGTYTSSPAGLSLNSSTGLIDLSLSTPGSYTVTYTTSGACSNSSNVTVVVNALPASPIITANGPTTFCSGSSVQLTSSQANGNMWSTGATTQAITATTSGAYIVTYTDVNGCSSSSQPIDVVVNANPNAPTITANGPTTFCDGGSVTLTSSQASGNVWSTTETTQSIVVTTSGIYEVTYTNTNGCSATSSQLTVNVNALPSVVLGSFTDMCSYADPIALTGGTPAGGTFSGTGVSSGVFDPSVAGVGTHTITYTYVDANGCANTAQSTIVVNDCAGIDELTLLGIQVYPNPASSSITVKSSKANIEQVRLIDAAGRLIIEEQPMMNSVIIDLTNYANGSYIIEMITVDGTARTQIIKQ